jgi:hypothetical protein
MGSFHVALLEALVSAGVPSERARAVVDLFDRSIDERYALHALKWILGALTAQTALLLSAAKLF